MVGTCAHRHHIEVKAVVEPEDSPMYGPGRDYEYRGGQADDGFINGPLGARPGRLFGRGEVHGTRKTLYRAGILLPWEAQKVQDMVLHSELIVCWIECG